MFFIKKILLFSILLFVLSCGSTVTSPNSNGNLSVDSSLTFLERVSDKLLVNGDGSYVYYHSDGGKTYTDEYGIYTFQKDISKTKGIYSKRLRDEYYGHEIRSGVLYVTDFSYDIDNINWESAKKVGSLVNDYSALFLNNVRGKSLSGCENYFDSQTGRLYIEKYTSMDETFDFVQALSETKAIYKKRDSEEFMGLFIVGGNLYSTQTSSTINAINWESATNVGQLQ